MSEKPILFSGEMVRAILAGRKTQTRRVVRNKTALEWLDGVFTPKFVADPGNFLSPYGYTGDSLWVREKWQAQNQDGFWWHEIKTGRELHNWAWTNPVEPAFDEVPPRWLPGIHMPKPACRLWLDVVDVRVERVQEITHFDAIAEGMSVDQHARIEYKNLWNEINEKRGFGWNVNPWVWAVTFNVVEVRR